MFRSILFIGFCLCAVSASAEDLPRRKAGLWEVSVLSPGMPPSVMKQCVDEKTDMNMEQMAGQFKDVCSKNELKRTGSGYTMESNCQMGNSRAISHGTLTGDFTTSYRMEMKSTFEPPMMGMKEAQTTMTAKHLGACAPGQKPGDVELPGGMKMNMDSVKGLQGKMPAMPR